MLRGLHFDISHTLSVSVLLLSFALLYQRRVMGVLNAFALQVRAILATKLKTGPVGVGPVLLLLLGRVVVQPGLMPVRPDAVCTRFSSGAKPLQASCTQVTPAGIRSASGRCVTSRGKRPPPTIVHCGW